MPSDVRLRSNRRARRDRIHAALDDRGAGRGRGEKFDQRLAGVGFLRDGGDAGGKHRDLLQLRRQWPDDIDAGNRKQFADLLEADLGVAARHDFGLPAWPGSPGLVLHLVGNAELPNISVET